MDYSFLCQTRRESSDPFFFSSRNGQYLTVHNILYCNVLSEDSCPASESAIQIVSLGNSYAPALCPVSHNARRGVFVLPSPRDRCRR